MLNITKVLIGCFMAGTAGVGSARSDLPITDDMPFGAALSGAQLGILAGQGDITSIEGRLDSNTLISTGTGGNTIDGNAFSSATGISNIIQNTGSQVLIQNSTTINLTQ